MLEDDNNHADDDDDVSIISCAEARPPKHRQNAESDISEDDIDIDSDDMCVEYKTLLTQAADPLVRVCYAAL